MNSARGRAIISVAGGTFLAVVLFLIMDSLITGGRAKHAVPPTAQIVDLVRVQDEEIVQIKQRVRPKRPPPKEPPPPPRLKLRNDAKPQTQPLRVDLPRIDVTTAAGSGPFLGTWQPGDAAREGEVEPIVRINPQYPRQALIDGTEGYVKFEVLIGKDGNVLDVKVIEAAPGRVFVREALRAVRRWVFKPRVVEGVPVERWATTSIVFELAD
ncbi:energy transducer TonB [Candidatus Poribacteria bacterium]|nr:MAG: energy transducer TonB [Candidatus Poribacteria bacterium]